MPRYSRWNSTDIEYNYQNAFCAVVYVAYYQLLGRLEDGPFVAEPELFEVCLLAGENMSIKGLSITSLVSMCTFNLFNLSDCALTSIHMFWSIIAG